MEDKEYVLLKRATITRTERSGWMRLIPFFDFHHVLMILIAVAIIFLSLLLAGCSSSSPLIPNIFLISFAYQPYAAMPSTAQVDFNAYSAVATLVGNARLAVRVGYFGICVNADGGPWLCDNNATALAVGIDYQTDPLNLVWLADEFKALIVFPYLIIIALLFAFICILLLATFPEWHEETIFGSELEVKSFPSRLTSQTALSLMFVASVFAFVSVLWQHTASVAASTLAQDLGNGSVSSVVGATAMILGWFGFVLLTIVTLGLLVMILSLKVVAVYPDSLPSTDPAPTDPILPPDGSPQGPPAAVIRRAPQNNDPPAAVLRRAPPDNDPPAAVLRRAPRDNDPPTAVLRRAPRDNDPPAAVLRRAPRNDDPSAAVLRRAPRNDPPVAVLRRAPRNDPPPAAVLRRAPQNNDPPAAVIRRA